MWDTSHEWGVRLNVPQCILMCLVSCASVCLDYLFVVASSFLAVSIFSSSLVFLYLPPVMLCFFHCCCDAILCCVVVLWRIIIVKLHATFWILGNNNYCIVFLSFYDLFSYFISFYLSPDRLFVSVFSLLIPLLFILFTTILLIPNE